MRASFVWPSTRHGAHVVTSDLAAAHPIVGTPCPACGEPFLVGQAVALVALGPGPAHGDQIRWAFGQVVDAPALPVHAACAGVPVDPLPESRRCSICQRWIHACECAPGGPLVAYEGDRVLTLEDVLARVVRAEKGEK